MFRSISGEVEEKKENAVWLTTLKKQISDFHEEAKADLRKDQRNTSGLNERTPKKTRAPTAEIEKKKKKKKKTKKTSEDSSNSEA